MSNLSQRFQPAAAGRDCNGTEAKRGLGAAELDQVTGGGSIWILVDGEPVRLIVRPQ